MTKPQSENFAKEEAATRSGDSTNVDDVIRGQIRSTPPFMKGQLEDGLKQLGVDPAKYANLHRSAIRSTQGGAPPCAG